MLFARKERGFVNKAKPELLGLIEIVDLQNDPVQCWRHFASPFARILQDY